VKNGHVLKSGAGLQAAFKDRRRPPDDGDALGRRLADDPGGQGRPGKRLPVEEDVGEPQGPADDPNAVLAQRQERLQDAVSERRLRIDAQLGEDVMLALDPGDRLVDIGQDGSLEQNLGSAFLDDPAENPPVEGLGDRLALFLGIGQTLQGGEKFLPGVDDLHRDAEGPE